MSIGSHDYTKEVPFDENPDDFVIPETTAATAQSAEEIERENSFSNVPPGDHLLVVSGFKGAPVKKYYRVTVNSMADGFEAYSVKVRFALPNNPKCTIEDFFLLPPDGAQALNAYYNGIPEGKKQAGWSALKFTHFINRLGFSFPPGGKLPEAARRLGNWKGRAIMATVEAGRGTWTDEDGNTHQRGPQIKSFSYRLATRGGQGGPTSGHNSHAGHTGGSSHNHAPQGGQPQSTSAGAFAGSGLDNI